MLQGHAVAGTVAVITHQDALILRLVVAFHNLHVIGNLLAVKHWYCSG